MSSVSGTLEISTFGIVYVGAANNDAFLMNRAAAVGQFDYQVYDVGSAGIVTDRGFACCAIGDQ